MVWSIRLLHHPIYLKSVTSNASGLEQVHSVGRMQSQERVLEVWLGSHVLLPWGLRTFCSL